MRLPGQLDDMASPLRSTSDLDGAGPERGHREAIWSMVLLALAFAFLSAPFVAGLLGERGGGTALQNRALNERPALTWSATWTARFGLAYTDWLWDHLPLRDRLLVLDHLIDDRVFGGSPSRDAFYGPGGFSWRRERILGGLAAGGTPPVELAAALDRVEAAFAAFGIPLHIVFTPTKASIYPEHLPEPYRVAHDEIAGPTERMLRARAHGDPRIVDLWTPCEAEKERLLRQDPRLPEDRRHLWRRNDDHWSYEGGWLQGKAIVQHIDPAIWDEAKAPHLTGKYTMMDAELSRLYLKIGIQEPYQFVVESPLTAVTLRHTHVRDSSYPGWLTTSAQTRGHTPAARTILVVRDSFLTDAGSKPTGARTGTLETIAPFFRRTVFMHWHALRGGSDQVAEYVRGVDDVVIQVTQANSSYWTERTNDLVALAGHVGAGRGLDPFDDGDALGVDVDPNAAAAGDGEKTLSR